MLGSQGNSQQVWSGTGPSYRHIPSNLPWSPLLPITLTRSPSLHGNTCSLLWSFAFASPVLGKMRQKSPNTHRSNLHVKEKIVCEPPQCRAGSRSGGVAACTHRTHTSLRSCPASSATGCLGRQPILHHSPDSTFPLCHRTECSVRFLSALRVCTQTAPHFFIMHYLLITCQVGDTKSMRRLKIRITRPITYPVKALNFFARTRPAIVSAKCYPKFGKIIHSEGIFKSIGQGLVQRGLRENKYILFISFLIYQVVSRRKYQFSTNRPLTSF